MKKKTGRQPKIPKEFYEFDYAAAAKIEQSAHVRVKLLALAQVKLGKAYNETAAMFQIHEKSVKAWMTRVVEEGVEGLKIKAGRGRTPILSPCKIDEFKQAIELLQDQRSGGRINVSDITQMAKEKFGAAYKEKGMYDLLHRINMVWISARSVHPSRNPAQQEAFKKTL